MSSGSGTRGALRCQLKVMLLPTLSTPRRCLTRYSFLVLQVRLLDVEDVPCKGENREYLEKIVEAEVEWQHMTLMHRYNLMREFYESFARRSEARLTSSSEYNTRAQRASELARTWAQRQWEGDEAPLPERFGACMKKALAAHDLLACGDLAAAEAAEET